MKYSVFTVYRGWTIFFYFRREFLWFCETDAGTEVIQFINQHLYIGWQDAWQRRSMWSGSQPVSNPSMSTSVFPPMLWRMHRWKQRWSCLSVMWLGLQLIFVLLHLFHNVYSDVYIWKPRPARQQSWQEESPQSFESTISLSWWATRNQTPSLSIIHRKYINICKNKCKEHKFPPCLVNTHIFQTPHLSL